MVELQLNLRNWLTTIISENFEDDIITLELCESLITPAINILEEELIKSTTNLLKNVHKRQINNTILPKNLNKYVTLEFMFRHKDTNRGTIVMEKLSPKIQTWIKDNI